jgi:hypothetical protein
MQADVADATARCTPNASMKGDFDDSSTHTKQTRYQFCHNGIERRGKGIFGCPHSIRVYRYALFNPSTINFAADRLQISRVWPP